MQYFSRVKTPEHVVDGEIYTLLSGVGELYGSPLDIREPVFNAYEAARRGKLRSDQAGFNLKGYLYVSGNNNKITRLTKGEYSLLPDAEYGNDTTYIPGAYNIDIVSAKNPVDVFSGTLCDDSVHYCISVLLDYRNDLYIRGYDVVSALKGAAVLCEESIESLKGIITVIPELEDVVKELLESIVEQNVSLTDLLDEYQQFQ